MRIASSVMLLLALAGCGEKSAESAAPPPAREAIEVAYVGAPELVVHAQPDDSSKVVAKYLNSESVSVLSRKSDWSEVRTMDGSGWVHTADLTNAAAVAAEEDNPNPKFRKAPAPVTQPGAHGMVYIEATVNTEGEVTATRIVNNTTGSAGLAAQNEAALRTAKFYPIVQRGKRKPFIYDYRVEY